MTQTPIDWAGIKSDEEIIARLHELMEEFDVSNTEMQSKSREEMETIIKEYLASKGFSSPVEVSISEPNDIGHRMFLGKTRSPITDLDINF